MTKRKFYAYRYLVTLVSQQASLFPLTTKSKEELTKAILENLVKNTKTEYYLNTQRYLFYGYQQQDNIFIIKFARESKQQVFQEGEKDIEITGIKETKFIFLIFDTKNQILLLQKNSTVFRKEQTAINIIEKFLQEQLKSYGYIIHLYPLVANDKFWSYVDQAKEIYELKLELNAPNLLFGNFDTRKALKKIQEETHNETLDVSLKNQNGLLKVIKSSIGKYVDYIREVGGRYMLDFTANGNRQTISSDTDIATTFIPIKKEDKYSSGELNQLRHKLDSIHHLKSRNNES